RGAPRVGLASGATSSASPPLFMQVAYRKSGTTTYTLLSPRGQLSVRFAADASSAEGLQGRPVSSVAPVSGQALKWNGTQWAPGADLLGVYKAGAGLLLTTNVFSIASGGVANAMLANLAVTNAKLADGSVITTKLANGAVTAAKIGWPLTVTLANASPVLVLNNTGDGEGVNAITS